MQKIIRSTARPGAKADQACNFKTELPYYFSVCVHNKDCFDILQRKISSKATQPTRQGYISSIGTGKAKQKAMKGWVHDAEGENPYGAKTK